MKTEEKAKYRVLRPFSWKGALYSRVDKPTLTATEAEAINKANGEAPSVELLTKPQAAGATE